MPEAEPFFTRKRVRGHATVLAVIVWLAYAASLTHPGLYDWLGQVKGTDFVHEYVLGKIALERNESLLYDYQGQSALAHQAIPGLKNENYLPIYGPQVSLVYAPFAEFSYAWAAVLWISLSAAIYLLCCYAVWKRLPNLAGEFSTVAILAVAFPGFFNMVGFGQNPAIALVAFTLAYLALRADRKVLAGMALGLLLYKPQFGLAAAFLFAATFEWKIILGGIAAAAAQAAVAIAWYGKQSLLDYAAALRNLSRNATMLEPKLYQMYSLRSFWQFLLPWPRISFALYALSAAAVLAFLYWSWRSAAPFGIRFAIFLVATVLVDPHLTSYDLIVLAPAFLLIGDWLLAQPNSPNADRLRWLLYFSYALPLFGPALRDLHFQAAVPVFFALLVLLALQTHRASTPKLAKDFA